MVVLDLERIVKTYFTSKVLPSPCAVCSVDEDRVVCCASRREDEGKQPGVPAWLRGRLDWIRRLTAGPHLLRRRAERPPVCLPLHQVSIWAWRKDGVSQRVSKWAKWGHWQPCVGWRCMGHTHRLASGNIVCLFSGFWLGGTNVCTHGQTHWHETKHPDMAVALDLSSLGSCAHSHHYTESAKPLK